MKQQQLSPFFFAILCATACGGDPDSVGSGELVQEPAFGSSNETRTPRVTTIPNDAADTEAEPESAPAEEEDAADEPCPFTDADCTDGRVFSDAICGCVEEAVNFGGGMPVVEMDEDDSVPSPAVPDDRVPESEPAPEPEQVAEPEPQVVNNDVVVNEPQPEPEPNVAANSDVCPYTDADCIRGRVMDTTQCRCVEDAGTCDNPGEAEECGNGRERVCAENYRYTECRSISQPLPEPEQVAEPEPSCESDCGSTAEPEAQPEPESQPEPEVTEPEPPAAEPEPQPEPEPESDPVADPAECVPDCTERGLECGNGSTQVDLFCAAFCDALPQVTESTKECLLSLPCDTLVTMVDADVAQEQVDECESTDATESESTSSDFVSLTFHVIVEATGGTLYLYTGGANDNGTGEAACASAQVKDPSVGNALVPGLICTVDVDPTVEIQGNLKAITADGEKWAAGWVTGPTDCRKQLRMYPSDEEGNVVADYDHLSSTSFPKIMASKSVTTESGDKTCWFSLSAGWNN